MQRYFFDVNDAGHVTPDEFGVDLADDEEAREQAIALLTSIVRDALPGGDEHELITKARNERNQIVYEASLVLHGRWWPGQRRQGI